jgi:hypothetical protein
MERFGARREGYIECPARGRMLVDEAMTADLVTCPAA